ncbi:MAG TPA: wax ester/triacylglycerol synthase family O-acyltransferase [Candidatus Competibacteraceae bacterium]|nr:wax ester/triacylglycerol synthase family O-acyltransferase [Candidatus Competibacteraceae bacterium]HRZ04548.1 wax ester/triacylglycerol synthase family O-acyltransferase [Candidatus Competibacteraceae bacterium]HSA45082.1 wax ester/triacylglycerol synthase family O-acyltransferase [Candidatus Competibacteraceae bacterium]
MTTDTAWEWADWGDVTWARMDTPTQPMVVTIMLLLATPLDKEGLKATLQNRLLSFARFRQRLVKRGIRYAWVEDATFDLNHHLEWRRLPEAVDQPALEALVGEIASQPLDMGQPLWRCVVVENAGAGSAVVFRVHHCIADGIALLRVFLALADRVPCLDEASAALEERRKQARLAAKTTKAIKPPPSGLERVRWGAAFVTALLRQAGLLPDTRTLLRGPLNGRKRMAWTAPIPLSDIADIRQRLGGRVNDVMLTAVAGAVGRYLRARGEMRPGLTARWVVPVNLRPYQEEIQLGNEFAVIFLNLPLDIPDPVTRLAAVRARMERVKTSPEAVANRTLIRLVGHLPDRLERWIIRLFGTKATAVLTNVPGPEETLYLAGAPVARGLAWVPQITGIGVGFCVLSYVGAITVGVTTDSGIVAEPGELVAGFEAEIAELASRVR